MEFAEGEGKSVKTCESLAEQIREQLFLVGVERTPEQADMAAIHIEQPTCETCMFHNRTIGIKDFGRCQSRDARERRMVERKTSMRVLDALFGGTVGYVTHTSYGCVCHEPDTHSAHTVNGNEAESPLEALEGTVKGVGKGEA